MEVSEDIQRELVYGLNALLLRRYPALPTAEEFASRLLAILREEGPRFHEPDLVGEWAEESGAYEELEDAIAESVGLVFDELTDEVETFAANRVLELLAEEPFWTITWGGSGGQSHVPIHAPATPSVPLPLPLRAAIVTTLDQLEVTLFELQSDQRSVEDRLDDELVDGLVEAAVRNVRELGRTVRIGDLPAALREASGMETSFEEVLGVIQRWKLAVGFDAAPDEDDGEWTMRVLDRLYAIDWFVPVAPA